eukprot:TRINITY_DN11764_c0_g2_i1.p2 TRINITY_DN11764_c0_g2~~TRINITY_DN11764_c0_g2_i1.p2  ORF type:complete len:158 (+),score=4.59 TRINITY_DN11764_c0_g2_i1:152-625(+)
MAARQERLSESELAALVQTLPQRPLLAGEKDALNPQSGQDHQDEQLGQNSPGEYCVHLGLFESRPFTIQCIPGPRNLQTCTVKDKSMKTGIKMLGRIRQPHNETILPTPQVCPYNILVIMDFLSVVLWLPPHYVWTSLGELNEDEPVTEICAGWWVS